MGFSLEGTALGFSGAVSGILIWPPFECPAVRRAVSQGPAFPSGGEADLPSPVPFPPRAHFFLALLRICWVGLVGERCRLEGTLQYPQPNVAFYCDLQGVLGWLVSRRQVGDGRALLHSSDQTTLIIRWSTVTNSEKTWPSCWMVLTSWALQNWGLLGSRISGPNSPLNTKSASRMRLCGSRMVSLFSVIIPCSSFHLN